MDKERICNMIISKPGGTAGKGSKSYRMAIPSIWAKEMGITENDRKVIIRFEDKKIIIEKMEAKMMSDELLAMEQRRSAVAKSLAISCTAAQAPTKSFMKALDDFVVGTISLEELNENIDNMMYIEGGD